MEQLAQDYKAVLGKLCSSSSMKAVSKKMPALSVVRVTTKSQIFASSEEVEKEIAAVEGHCNGWIRRQSRVAACPRSSSGGGVPLNGEWALSDNESLQLTYDGRQWHLWTFEEKAASEAGGDIFLKQEQALLFASEFARSFGPAAQGIQKLNYAVYWAGEAGNIERRFARFTGFDKDQQEK